MQKIMLKCNGECYSKKPQKIMLLLQEDKSWSSLLNYQLIISVGTRENISGIIWEGEGLMTRRSDTEKSYKSRSKIF